MKRVTASAIAELLGGELVGDPEKQVVGVGDLRAAGPEQLAFVRGQRFVDLARQSRAGILLVPEVLEGLAQGTAQIVVRDVDAAFTRAALHFHPVPVADRRIVHPTAVVHPDADVADVVEIGAHAVVEARARLEAGVVLGPGVCIGAGSVVGERSVLRANVVLYPRVTIGARCIVHSGTVLGSDGFGYTPDRTTGEFVKVPQLGTLEIGDDCEIGANVTIDRGALGPTRIGSGTKIDNLVHVGHNCDIGKHVAIAGFSALSGSTKLGDHVVCAGHVVSAGHLSVPAGTRVGGASVLRGDVDEPGDYIGYPLVKRATWGRILKVLQELPDIRRALRRSDRDRSDGADGR
jgi:UDP-3-O-[3-hydroxymyristoyl] glucosamine N-acyltransferase